MTPRERALTALRRQRPDRVPFWLEFTPPMFDVFRERTGQTDPVAYFDFEFRQVEFAPVRETSDFSQWLPGLPNGARINEWGIGFVKGTGYSHLEDMIHPLQRAETVREIESYPYPDILAAPRWEDLRTQVESWHDKGYAVRGVPPIFDGTIFETAWGLRSLEELLVDFIARPELAEALLDRVTDLSLRAAVIMAEAGVDVLITGDDIGTQSRMMMSMDMWRRWLKPRLGKVIAAAKAKRPDLLIFYHSCGFIEPAIPELIEIGVDILHPVQPESMDPVKIKRLYGDRLSFWGTIGTQTTMPFGTPEEVRATVARHIEVLGENGGLLVAPTHVLEPEVPWENVIAFVEAVKAQE